MAENSENCTTNLNGERFLAMSYEFQDKQKKTDKSELPNCCESSATQHVHIFVLPAVAWSGISSGPWNTISDKTHKHCHLWFGFCRPAWLFLGVKICFVASRKYVN